MSEMRNLYEITPCFQANSLILRAPEEIDMWMDVPAEEALKLQITLPDNDLIAVA